MLNDIFTRLSQTSTPKPSTMHSPQIASVRVEVFPPPMRRGTHSPSWHDGWQASLRDWLQSAWPTSLGNAQSTQSHWPQELSMTAQSNSPLSLVRREFIDSLHDIRTQQAGDLLGRIRVARSMRDLWHLRTEIYNLVSIQRDEAEAASRLNRLNRFFPQRASRPCIGQAATPVEPRGDAQ